MSENNNEQMDLGSGATSNDEMMGTGAAASSAGSPQAEVTTTGKDASSMLKLSIKTPKEKKDVSIDLSATVKQVPSTKHSFTSLSMFTCLYAQLKDLVAREFNTSLEQLCLIYSGKILKDDEDLKKHGKNAGKFRVRVVWRVFFVRLRLDIKDGVTIHLVIRAPKTESMATSATTGSAASGETPAGANQPNAGQPSADGFPFGLGMAPGMGNLNFANTNFLDMQQQLQQQVVIPRNVNSND